METEAQGSPEAVLVMTTVHDEEQAISLARALVSRSLAACVTVQPRCRSVYSWKGEICEDEELMLLIKTRAENAGRIRELFATAHPYELPEMVVIDIAGGSDPYLAWVLEHSRSDAAEEGA
jgi:periplasmic divalent cation tolerance protein